MTASTLVRSQNLTASERLYRHLLLKALTDVQIGTLTLQDPDGQHVVKGHQDADRLHAHIDVLDTGCYRDLVLGGSIGAGEAYMTGDWCSPDLTTVIRFMALNLKALNALEGGLARLTRPLQRLHHWRNRNTEKGSRRNIAAHYDLGNALFQLFLDPTLMYSSAIFPGETATLEQASIAKLDHICRKLELKPDEHVIEIGTGWGGFAIHAATHYGCRVTTTTLSRQQYDFAREKIRALGLEDRIHVQMQDYRDLQGQYDKLVSIEMVEAVGHQYYDAYFAALGRLLKPTGLALIQAITIDHPRFRTAIRSVDFIQRYIFPGSCIPSVTALLQASGHHSDLELIQLEDITLHYARTLHEWRHRFLQQREAVKALGYSDDFIRLWEFYFCYCEGGFQERVIGDAQLLFAKPEYRAAGSN